jgi:hypothetical protein
VGGWVDWRAQECVCECREVGVQYMYVSTSPSLPLSLPLSHLTETVRDFFIFVLVKYYDEADKRFF